MKKFLSFFASISVTFLVSFKVVSQASSPVCVTSTEPESAYDLELCIHEPSPGDILEEIVQVTASVEAAEAAPGISKVVFYLNGDYLLTDFEAPFQFELPTNRFIDGDYTLAADVTLNDDFVSEQASLEVTFANGVTELPVNENTFEPYTGASATIEWPFVVAVVGDGASGQTLEVPELIASWNPDMLLYLGDVYNRGTYTEFYNWYGTETSGFGQFRSITNPVIGDHEYATNRGADYYDYWDNVPPYYSFDVGGWHFIALNSITTINAETQQYEWLVEDLSTNTSSCAIAFYHHPIYSIGPHGGEDRNIELWPLLVQHGVDAVFNGNDHNYQRWHPLDADGAVDSQGVTEFIVGTGGRGARTQTTTDDRVAAAYDRSPDALGAMRLELNEDGMTFMYININGEVLDSGAIACDSTNPDTTPPTTPENLEAGLDANDHVVLSWGSAADNTGIAGYTVYRDGTEIGSTAPGIYSYNDASTNLGTSYTYAVAAFDLAGNQSALSNETSITTPTSRTLSLEPVADSYVSVEEPAANYGSRSSLRLDTTPELRGYLRFEIPEFSGSITKATLEIYANSNSSDGYIVYSTSGDWDEDTITYENAPPIEIEIESSGTFTADTRTTVDVTDLITGESELNIALVSTTPTAISLASRESDNPPRLIIEVADNSTS